MLGSSCRHNKEAKPKCCPFEMYDLPHTSGRWGLYGPGALSLSTRIDFSARIAYGGKGMVSTAVSRTFRRDLMKIFNAGQRSAQV